MRILQVSAELFPLLKTGGLADIAGALPLALMAEGEDARVLLPGFPAIVAGVRDLAPVDGFNAPWGERFGLRLGHIDIDGAPGIPAYVIDAPALYGRPGNPYEDTSRQPYGDNHRRFALLGWAAAQLAQGLDPQWRPEVVHAHDWHAALAPAYLHFARQAGGPHVGSVFTVHNLAYQGIFAPWNFTELGLPGAAFQMNGLEYHGQVSFMKGACTSPTGSPRSARPTRSKSRRPSRAADSTACCASAAGCSAASSTRSTTRSGTRRPTPR